MLHSHHLSPRHGISDASMSAQVLGARSLECIGMTVRHCLRQVVFAEHLAAEPTATELVGKADERLLAAKRGGRNRTVAQDL